MDTCGYLQVPVSCGWSVALQVPDLLRQVTCGNLHVWIRIRVFESEISAGWIQINPQVNSWGALTSLNKKTRSGKIDWTNSNFFAFRLVQVKTAPYCFNMSIYIYISYYYYNNLKLHNYQDLEGTSFLFESISGSVSVLKLLTSKFDHPLIVGKVLLRHMAWLYVMLR